MNIGIREENNVQKEEIRDNEARRQTTWNTEYPNETQDLQLLILYVYMVIENLSVKTLI